MFHIHDFATPRPLDPTGASAYTRTEPPMPEPKTSEQQRQDRNRERVLYGLSLDYTIAFVLDLDTDGYDIVFSQATNHAQKNELAKYTDYVARYADHFVIPEQRETFCHELNYITIREKLETRGDYHYSFETTPVSYTHLTLPTKRIV